MYRITKYQQSFKNNLFFSSDWHVFHRAEAWPIPIWKERGYSSPEEAAEDVQRKINAKVAANDHLYFLGDGFLNATEEGVKEWLDGIECQNIYYLFGNHASVPYRLYRDEIQRQFGRNDIEVYPLRVKNLVFLGNHHEIQVGKQKIVLNHFPIHSWNSMNKLSWNLHGHSHLSDPTTSPLNPLHKRFDIGWDWKRDVWSYAEIEEIMSAKTFASVDHHERIAI